jgi:type II secretory pathway pseudopilin PulG
MPPVVVLQGDDELAVQPGQTVSCQLSLANTGSIVEQFTILLLGDVEAWTTVEPPVVSLFPGAQQTVTLTFAPPRSFDTTAGLIHFGVKVIPSNEPEESVTEEGSITVGTFNDLGAELLPRVTTGRFAARQRLAVDSRGNVPIPVTVSAVDGADALKFRINPEQINALPGAAHFVRIRVAPRQRFYRGAPQQKPYKVTVEAEGEKPLVLDGAISQKAVFPKWLFPLLMILAILVLLWFFVFKPAIHNEAVSANKAALAAQAAQTQAAAAQAAQANAASQANAAALAKLTGKPAPTTTTTTTTVPKKTAPTTTTVPPPVTEPSDGELEVVAAPGSTSSSATGPLPSGTTLTISDLVIQNISGSNGTARIERVIPGKPTQDLLIENLGTLTSQEFTFPTSMIFTHDQQLQLRVDCDGGQGACQVGIYYTGPVTEPVADTTTTIP